MPAKRAVTEKEFFKNAHTWKQISTNVPPRMLEKLKSHVTPDFTVIFKSCVQPISRVLFSGVTQTVV